MNYSHNTHAYKRSPTKLSSSISLSERSNHKTKTQVSPRKNPQYSVHHQGKLKVFVKFRPPSDSSSKLLNVSYLSPNEVQIERQSNNKVYSFDRVYHHSIPSQEVFSTGCKDVIDHCISNVGEDKNGLIFVYGHTGTGKTFTMGLLDEINRNSKGIVPESLRYIFSQPNIVKIGLSFNQIYMDEVYDMLDFESDRKLTIREHQTTKEPYIENQIMISISSVEQAYQLINIGLEKRRVAEQKVNKRSSRGHGILTINIATKSKESRICFVDLAGSERIKESESSGKALTEAVHINTSLSALETLLMNIGEQSVRMYRGNKLTRLLQPFLESGKIRLFVTSNYENIQPIEFAKRCKGIKFMEREIVEPKASLSPQLHQTQSSKKALQKIKELETLNKNLIYCVTNMLGLFDKVSQMMNNCLDEQNLHCNFSLSDNFSIKNEELEQRVNLKIQKLESMEEQILDREMPSSIGCVSALSTSGICDNLSDISALSASGLLKNPQNLIGSIKDNPTIFVKKVHEIGFNIFQSIKQLSSLSEYRNIYKKQIFTSELKACLLQNKNVQFQNAINYLLKSYQKQAQTTGNTAQVNKVIKQLSDIGVNIGNMKGIPNTGQAEPKRKNNNGESRPPPATQVNNTNSNTSSRIKAVVVENKKKVTPSKFAIRSTERTPTKSAKEEYNEFLPFEAEHSRNNANDVGLFEGENTNYSNHTPIINERASISKLKPTKKLATSPIKRRQPKTDNTSLLYNQRRSLILIQDL